MERHLSSVCHVALDGATVVSVCHVASDREHRFHIYICDHRRQHLIREIRSEAFGVSRYYQIEAFSPISIGNVADSNKAPEIKKVC